MHDGAPVARVAGTCRRHLERGSWPRDTKGGAVASGAVGGTLGGAALNFGNHLCWRIAFLQGPHVPMPQSRLDPFIQPQAQTVSASSRHHMRTNSLAC